MIKPVKSDLITLCQKIIDNPHKVAIIDSETTGLKGEILDLSIIDPNGNVLYDSLLKPLCPIEASAKAIHHIDETMVSSAPSFSDEWPKIHNAIKGRIVIAYNAAFDHERFIYTAKRHNVSLPASTWQCLMKSYASYFDAPPKYDDRPEPAWQKLEKACEQQGINIGIQEHRALSDTRTTLALIKRIAQLGTLTTKYHDIVPLWTSTITIDELLSKPRLQGQDTVSPELNNAFQDVNIALSDLQRSDESTRGLQVIGECCRCGKAARHISPGGSMYCDEHNKCKNGHEIQWVLNEETKTWLCSCYLNKDLVQKALI